MRTRLLIAAGVIALVGAFAPVGVAHAQPEGEAEEHCIELLEEGGAIDDCQEAPNPLIPGVNEIIWGSAAFAILFFVLWKWGLPPIRNMMKRREDRIREDLERAERAQTEAAEIRARAQEDARLAGERAAAELQRRVADLSIELAERIVERNLDRDTQLALVERYIDEVATSGNGSR